MCNSTTWLSSHNLQHTSNISHLRFNSPPKISFWCNKPNTRSRCYLHSSRKLSKSNSDFLRSSKDSRSNRGFLRSSIGFRSNRDSRSNRDFKSNRGF